MKYNNFVFDPKGVGGYSGLANKWVMNQPHSLAVFS